MQPSEADCLVKAPIATPDVVVIIVVSNVHPGHHVHTNVVYFRVAVHFIPQAFNSHVKCYTILVRAMNVERTHSSLYFISVRYLITMCDE